MALTGVALEDDEEEEDDDEGEEEVGAPGGCSCPPRGEDTRPSSPGASTAAHPRSPGLLYRPAHREAQERRERAARAAAGGSQGGGSMDVEEGELAGAEKSTGCSCMEGDRVGCLSKEGKGGWGAGGVGVGRGSGKSGGNDRLWLGEVACASGARAGSPSWRGTSLPPSCECRPRRCWGGPETSQDTHGEWGGAGCRGRGMR